MQYGYVKRVNVGFDAAVAQIRDALGDQGFGVLTEIDVQAVMKKKLDRDMPRYLILGACNPQLAATALDAEPNIGLMLPCNVVVRETDGGVEVSIAKPEIMFEVVDNDALTGVADEADRRLKAALEGV